MKCMHILVCVPLVVTVSASYHQFIFLCIFEVQHAAFSEVQSCTIYPKIQTIVVRT